MLTLAEALVNKNKSERIKLIPVQSGCYLLKDNKNTVVYIGKAKNLRQRIINHLQNNQEENSKFLGLIADWEIILTSNVKEALILEQSLIKKYHPRFNILLKDDHFYPYIRIVGKDNPRYLLTRNKPLNYQKEEMCFGPFPDGAKSGEVLQILERLFPLAKCPGNLGKPYENCKPCLYYYLNQCSGHCFQKVSAGYYQKTKQQILAFFRRKSQVVKKKIQKSLQTNIVNQEFELAKKEKKILDNLDFFTSQQNIEFSDRRSYDFFGFFYQNDFFSCYFLIYRYGKLSMVEEKVFKVYELLTEKAEIIFTYLYQFYQKNPPPDVLCLPEKIEEGEEILREKFGFICQIPQRGRKKKILELSQKNAYHTWQKGFSGSFQGIDKVKILEELKDWLEINTPFFIEVLDVSNLFQEDVVAGFLTCINGEINYAKSKLYQLNNKENKSDFDWIFQACQKHYRKKNILPDLLIVDGGKAQIRAALKALEGINKKLPVIGLVKNERHQTKEIITNNLASFSFKKKETVKLFLTNLQESVHQYVINFHRKLHRRSSLFS